MLLTIASSGVTARQTGAQASRAMRQSAADKCTIKYADTINNYSTHYRNVNSEHSVIDSTSETQRLIVAVCDTMKLSNEPDLPLLRRVACTTIRVDASRGALSADLQAYKYHERMEEAHVKVQSAVVELPPHSQPLISAFRRLTAFFLRQAH